MFLGAASPSNSSVDDCRWTHRQACKHLQLSSSLNPARVQRSLLCSEPRGGPSSGHFGPRTPKPPGMQGLTRFRNLRPLCAHTALSVPRSAAPHLHPARGVLTISPWLASPATPRDSSSSPGGRSQTLGSEGADTPSLAFHLRTWLGPQETWAVTRLGLFVQPWPDHSPSFHRGSESVGHARQSCALCGRTDTMPEGHHHHHPFHHPALRGPGSSGLEGQTVASPGAAILSLIRTAVDSVFQAAATIFRYCDRHHDFAPSLLRMTPILQTWRLRLRKPRRHEGTGRRCRGQTMAGGGQGTNTISQPLRCQFPI